MHTSQWRLVASMATLSRDLGINIIAEGVETAEEAAVLTELVCPLHQGY